MRYVPLWLSILLVSLVSFQKPALPPHTKQAHQNIKTAIKQFNELPWDNKQSAVDSLLSIFRVWEQRLPLTDTLLDDAAHKLAIYFYNTNTFEKAIYWYKKELAYLNANQKSSKEAVCHAYFGLVASLLENFEFTEAERYLNEEGLILKRKLVEEAHLLGDYHYNFSRTAYKMGDFNRCVEKGELALHFFKRADASKVFNREYCLLLLGAANDELQRPEKALTCYNEAEKAFKSAELDFGISLCLNNKGIALRMLGKLDSAQLLLEKAAALNENLDEPIELARNYIELAKVQSQMNKMDKAAFFAEKSLQLRQENLPEFHPDLVECLLFLGELEQKKSKDEGENALFFFERAWNAAQKSEIAYLEIQPLFRLAATLSDKAEDTQELKLAHEYFNILDSLIQITRRSFPSEASRIHFSGNVYAMYEAATANVVELFRKEQSTAYFDAALLFSSRTKAKALQESIQNAAALAMTIVPESIKGQERNFQYRLVNLNEQFFAANHETERHKLKTSITQTKVEQELFLRHIETQFPEYFELKYKKTTHPSCMAIQEKLNEKTAFVEFFLGENALFTFYIDNASYKIEKNENRTSLQNLLEAYRNQINIEDQNNAIWHQTSHNLFNALFQNTLPNDGHVQELRLLLDGLLYQVPFDALLTEEATSIDADSPFLLKKFGLSYLTSQAQLFEHHSGNTTLFGKRFKGFAIDFKQGNMENLPPLDFAISEAKQIQNQLGGHVFINEKANQSAFYEALQTADVLHLSTHGSYHEQNALQSALYFYKENTISPITVNALFAHKTQAELIFLSACQTGNGQLLTGEGLLGFSRVLQYIGAKSQIMSLWNLPDQTASTIANAFYKNLKKGHSKSKSLRLAKLDYLQNCPTALGQQPYFWASTVLLGNPEPLYLKPWTLWAITVTSLLAIGLFGRAFWRNRKNRVR